MAGASRIVLADQDESFRSFVAGLLKARGAELVQVKSAEDAERIAKEFDVGLAVIDARLEDASGAQLVERLRASGATFPIIFMQEGWQEQNSYRHLTDKLGVRRVMHKPFSAYEFIVEIEGALREHPAATVAPETLSVEEDDATRAERRKRSYPSLPAFDAAGPPSQNTATTLALVGEDEQLAAMVRSAAEDAFVVLLPMKDGEEVVAKLEEEPLDGVLFMVDAEDPDMAYAEATEVLCSEDGQHLPVGFVCASSSLELQVDAIRAGGCSFLGAPVEGKHLQQVANRMTQLRRGTTPQIVVVAGVRQGQALTLALDQTLVSIEVVPHAMALLKRLESVTPDLVLYDLDTRGASGRDLCKLMRANPQWSALPVMLLSSNDSPEARIAAFEAGADDFMVKPVVGEELVTRTLARMQRTRDHREVADRDPRTGLMRRHAFVERALAMTAEAGRGGREVALCVLGLDEVPNLPSRRERGLAEVSGILAAQLRTYDLRARWENDEIILALADVDRNAVKPLLERILQTMRQRDLHCSVGVAIYPTEDHVLPTLVNLARGRFRRARKGKRKVVVVG